MLKLAVIIIQSPVFIFCKIPLQSVFKVLGSIQNKPLILSLGVPYHDGDFNCVRLVGRILGSA